MFGLNVYNYSGNVAKTPVIESCNFDGDELEILSLDDRTHRVALSSISDFVEEITASYGAQQASQTFALSIDERAYSINHLALLYMGVAFGVVAATFIPTMLFVMFFAATGGDLRSIEALLGFHPALLGSCAHVYDPYEGYAEGNRFLAEQISVGNQNLSKINAALSKNENYKTILADPEYLAFNLRLSQQLAQGV